MRKPIIAGNWKMFKTVTETEEFLNDLKSAVAGVEKVEVVVCPPFTSLAKALELTKGTNIKVGAQNMFYEDKGAFTGEVAPGMLKDLGCHYVIIGHSERRQYFGETNETVNQKLKAAFIHGIIPILCVGEKLEDREKGITESLIKEQVEKALEGLTPEQIKSLVIAYEPVWAIGTGKTASKEDAQQVIGFIRGVVYGLYGAIANEVRIQYGGSVKPENIAELMAQADIDGALVGGASLEVASFTALVRYEHE
jgi:triosephosphate isomerase (TIM)